jgi:hypothetical protein
VVEDVQRDQGGLVGDTLPGGGEIEVLRVIAGKWLFPAVRPNTCKRNVLNLENVINTRGKKRDR